MFNIMHGRVKSSKENKQDANEDKQQTSLCSNSTEVQKPVGETLFLFYLLLTWN